MVRRRAIGSNAAALLRNTVVKVKSGGRKKRRQPGIRIDPRTDTATDWESRVLAKIANRVEAVVPPREESTREGSTYGWEQRSLNRLAEHVRRKRRR